MVAGDFNLIRISKDAVLYDAARLTASNFILQLLGFGYRIFLGRETTAEGMGVYQLVFPFYSIIISVALSGLCVAASRLSAERMALHEGGQIRRIVRACIGIFLIMFALVAAFTLLFSHWIAADLLGDMRVRRALILILPCLFFTGFENIFKSAFYGRKDIAPTMVSEILELALRFGCVYVLFHVLKPEEPGFMAAVIVAGMVISEVFSSSLLAILYNKRMPPAGGKSEFKPLSAVLAVALPISTAGLINNLLNSVNTVLVPKRLMAAGMSREAAMASFGTLFGLSMPLIFIPSVFIGALCTVVLPRVTEGFSREAMDAVRRKTAKALHATGLLVFPCVGIITALGEGVFELIYNRTGVVTYIVPLSLASIFAYYQAVTATALHGVGMQRQASISAALSGVIQLAFTWFLTGDNHFGLYGFILGEAVSAFIAVIMNVVWLKRKISLRIQWVNWLVLPGLSAIFCGLVANIINLYLRDNGIMPALSLIAAANFGILGYLALLRLQGTNLMRYIKSLAK